MDFYIQYAHGMMDISKNLAQAWQGSTVILSPRDILPAQIAKLRPHFQASGTSLLFDPQCYAPRANHPRLTQYSYWMNDFSTGVLSPAATRSQLTDLYENHNLRYGTTAFIVPGQYITAVDDIWTAMMDMTMDQLAGLPHELPRYLTVCLSSSVLRDEGQVHTILEYIESLAIEGIYLVAEPPAGMYLVDDPIWLKNLLDFCAGVKLDGKKVIVGYANHQYLLLALAKVDAIASGNFLNSRRFGNDKFFEKEDSPSRRSTWYYCPQALSEYQIPFLDLAQSVGILSELATDPSLGSTYADILFAGAQPSSVDFHEPKPFYHYLQCLKAQTGQATHMDYLSTKQSLLMRLETAWDLTERFRNNGVRGKDRDFANIYDAMLSSATAFHNTWGLRLQSQWASI